MIVTSSVFRLHYSRHSCWQKLLDTMTCNIVSRRLTLAAGGQVVGWAVVGLVVGCSSTSLSVNGC